MLVTCPVACTKSRGYKWPGTLARRFLHREGEGSLPADPPPVHPPAGSPAAGRRAGERAEGRWRRRRFGGFFATRWRSLDQCQSRPGRGEQGKKKKGKKKKSWPLFIWHPWSRTGNYCPSRAQSYKKPLGMPGGASQWS